MYECADFETYAACKRRTRGNQFANRPLSKMLSCAMFGVVQIRTLLVWHTINSQQQVAFERHSRNTFVQMHLRSQVINSWCLCQCSILGACFFRSIQGKRPELNVCSRMLIYGKAMHDTNRRNICAVLFRKSSQQVAD